MIYLDYAATSWPKPPEVLRAMTEFLEQAGGNPGRSGHRLSIEAGRVVYETRERVATLFDAPDPLRVVLTPNVTYAINMALHGLLAPGHHVVTTGIEHNAVMRPLRALERRGIDLTVVPCAPDGTLNIADLRSALRPDTRLVTATHASNVMGTILPVDEIIREAHAVGALVLVDAAQTAGALPISLRQTPIDLLAFTGHKGLQGPPGTGGLVVAENVDVAAMEPVVCGGTGSHSEFEEQPTMLPDRFESGTPNGPGIAGLGAALQVVLERGVEAIRAHELALTRRLIEGLAAIPGVTVYGPTDYAQRTATVSITVEGYSVSEVGFMLDEEYDIMCRVGLHCAPAAHRTLGTFPEGTVRLAPGMLTREDEIDTTLRAIERIVRR
jgi:cysteine desulfurase/selenocysteine lyase